MTGDSSPFFPGSADLLWQSDRPYVFLQNDDGGAFVWATDGSTVTGGGGPGNPGPSWHVKASGDFNANGNPDILWQNDSGEAAIWEMNGTTVIGAASIGNPGPSWHVKTLLLLLPPIRAREARAAGRQALKRCRRWSVSGRCGSKRSGSRREHRPRWAGQS